VQCRYRPSASGGFRVRSGGSLQSFLSWFFPRSVREVCRSGSRLLCAGRWSRTRSYPDRWDQTQRPLGHTGLTRRPGKLAPVQTEVEHRPVRSQHRTGQRLAGRREPRGRSRRSGPARWHGRERAQDVNSRIALRGGMCWAAPVMNGFGVGITFRQEHGPAGPARSNPSWHLTRPSHHRRNHGVPWAGSPSLGRRRLRLCRSV
jgi:hypothetical protein